jgi:uncharacterized protein YndB with AHSA1/START domain
MITVKCLVHSTRENVWDLWTKPEHIRQWCAASQDWHVPDAENDLRIGGKFKTVMAARDGSASFDFEGTYDDIKPCAFISYRMADGRRVRIKFEESNEGIYIDESFDPEDIHSHEMQRSGWQSILDNFKLYVEKHLTR